MSTDTMHAQHLEWFDAVEASPELQAMVARFGDGTTRATYLEACAEADAAERRRREDPVWAQSEADQMAADLEEYLRMVQRKGWDIEDPDATERELEAERLADLERDRIEVEAMIARRDAEEAAMLAAPAPVASILDRMPPEMRARIEAEEAGQATATDPHRDLVGQRLAFKRADAEAREIFEQEQAEAATKPIPLYSVADLLSRPAPVMRIRDAFSQDETILLAGPSGGGKSFYMLDAALCVATGKPFMGEMEVIPGKVLYVAGEGVSGMPKRIAGWSKHYGLDLPEGSFMLADEGVNLSSDSSVNALRALVREHQFDFIVFDTFRKLTKVESENDPNGITKVANNVDLIRREVPGCSATVVHHTNKAGMINGTEAFRSDFDTVWVFKGSRHGFAVSSDTDDGGKNKNSEPVVIEGMRLETVHVSHDVRTAVVIKAPSTLTPEPDLTEHLDEGRQYSRAELLAYLCELKGVSESTAERTIRNLTDSGKLMRAGYGKYSVTPAGKGPKG